MTDERPVIAFFAHQNYRYNECNGHDDFVMCDVEYKAHSL